MTTSPRHTDVIEAIEELRLELERDAGQAEEGYSDRLGVNRCKAKQTLTQMCFGTPTVMMTIVGEKVVTVEDRQYRLKPGDIFLLPEEVTFDVVNIPNPRANRYLGIAIRFDGETMSVFRDLYGAQFEDWDLTPKWQVKGSAKVIAATASWISWIGRFSTDQAQVRHRMIELMLLFASQGVAGNLILKLHHSWKHRLKQLFLLDPARPWRMGDACRRLGVSESTLRRHLREEDIGFRELLEIVRLEHGMGLVMSTDMLIAQVSLACGYQSQSRFGERFKLRFSMSPIELRNSRNAEQERGNVIPASFG